MLQNWPESEIITLEEQRDKKSVIIKVQNPYVLVKKFNYAMRNKSPCTLYNDENICKGKR